MPPTGRVIDLAAAAPRPETPPVERCACGSYVVASRGARALHFYCTSCGADWQRDVTPVPVPVPRRVPGKRCQCSTTCRFCRLPRGRA